MKHFRILITILFTVSLFQFCKFEKPLNPRKATITGDISNLAKHQNKKWIEIIHPDLFSQEAPIKQVEIDSLGHFRYEMEIISPALCWGIYNKWFPFVISPGDSLHFSIDASIWSDSISGDFDKGKYTNISNSDNEDYKSIISFQNWANDSVYTREKSKKINVAYSNKSPTEFKEFIQNNENEVLTQIKSFGRKEKAGKLFYDILEEEIYYRTLDNLVRYYLENSFNGNCFKNIVLPEEYFSFLYSGKIENLDFFVSHRIDFVKDLVILLGFRNAAERQTFFDIYLRKNGLMINDNYFKNQAKYICSQTKGITRDLCLYFFALNNLRWIPSKADEICASVSNLIKEPYVNKYFNEKYNLKLQNIKPKTEKIKSTEYTALDSLISKNKGKVIYVDFWAPWCGACIGEMPYSKQLKESFKGKDIVFIYLACNCTVNSWKATIANNDISGVNLLLSNDDYGKLKRRFEISGIPHFLLINKKGEVINKNAPRPSDDNIKTAILELL